MGNAQFQDRFLQNLRSLLPGEADPPHLLVAFSGGLDSTVLLHLLHFGSGGIPLTVTAAHFDHRMRPGSEDDAEWVCGLCGSWGVPLESGAASAHLGSEDAARRARYDFLRSAAARVGAAYILTAHHADDQAETVLFRVLRGTGMRGLRGIAPRTRSGLLRPLLPFWREELASYARAHELNWRDDPTNESHGPARNRIRLRLLPEVEAHVAPAARHSLVALAELARESEAGWRALLAPILERVVERQGGAFVIARDELRTYDPAVATRIVREVLRRFGTVPSRIGTRSALKFITDAPSGREMQLSGKVRIRIEFGRARVERHAAAIEDRPFTIPPLPERGEVSGEVVVGGRRLDVLARLVARSAVEPVPAEASAVVVPCAELRFPLILRGREPGDRIRTAAGTKSLKKLMIERRIPRSERSRTAVLVDAAGEVRWVAGLATPPTAEAPDELVLHLVLRDGGPG